VRREEPVKKAVALLYDSESACAPRVVAGGKGELAARIVEVARESGLPIMQDPDLLEVLAKVPVGEEIPIELYQAVAEILAFVYRINGKYKETRQEPCPES
jgi:flagellar biosynthesis protein